MNAYILPKILKWRIIKNNSYYTKRNSMQNMLNITGDGFT